MNQESNHPSGLTSLTDLAVQSEQREAEYYSALMINQPLAKYQAPSGIGEFLKGIWYQGAQRVYLTYGPESGEWRHMSATTELLLRSVQKLQSPSDARLRRLAGTLENLPEKLHGGLHLLLERKEEIESEINIIEDILQQVLRNSHPDLAGIEAIAVVNLEEAPAQTISTPAPPADDSVTAAPAPEPQQAHWEDKGDEILLGYVGRWLGFHDNGCSIMGQLAVHDRETNTFLFVNRKGEKVRTLSKDDFVDMINNNLVELLASKPLTPGDYDQP